MLKTSTHKQERALVTRGQLIEAARIIFARDGFQSTRIEDIAAEAGKTRGAFYDHFRDKEDVFFAIFEEDISRDQGRMIDEMSAAPNLEGRIDVLARHLGELLKDERRILLILEFKMYVIRHPQKRKRLSELYAEMCLRCSMTKINTLFPEMIDASVERRKKLTMEVGAIMDGLALNSLFSPESLSDEQRTRYLRVAAEEALQAAQRR
jgi:AcrR family transcriptional regulator